MLRCKDTFFLLNPHFPQKRVDTLIKETFLLYLEDLEAATDNI